MHEIVYCSIIWMATLLYGHCTDLCEAEQPLLQAPLQTCITC